VEPTLLDAVNVEEKVPALVGVPLINPFVAMLNPYADRILVPVNVIGAVPLAVTVLLNGTPTVPLKELVEVKVGALFVETTDVVFALDSIPAIFAVTRDPFLVFTSNIFAILGLRSMYFVLADVVHRFATLKIGLAFVLIFVGIKMALRRVFRRAQPPE
jgi:hypothetical protein